MASHVRVIQVCKLSLSALVGNSLGTQVWKAEQLNTIQSQTPAFHHTAAVDPQPQGPAVTKCQLDLDLVSLFKQES